MKRKVLLKILICLAVVFCVCNLTACKKKENIDDLAIGLNEYVIDMSLDNMIVTAQEKLNYCNKNEDVLTNIKFHLYPKFFEQGGTSYVVSSTKMNEAYPNGVDYAVFDVTRVCVDNVDVEVKYEGEMDGILNVELPNRLLPDQSVKINIDFKFELPVAEHRFGYGDNTINICNFYPITCVYENGEFDVSPYNSNGDPFYSEMANYFVNITADKNLVVAGTGVNKNEIINENKKTTTFEAKLVRDFALVLSEDFEMVSEKVGDTTVTYYYYDDNYASESLKAGVDALKTFSNLFGNYPYSTFNIVKAGFVYGGMEYPNLVIVSDDISNLDDYLNVIIHETAHQWWYGVVGNDEFKYPWLDEALTEYSTCMFYDYNENYNLTKKGMIDACRDNYSLFVSVYTDVLGSLDTSMREVDKYATEPEYTYCTYVKGVLMFDSLENLVGSEKFLKSLKNYYQNHKYSIATPENLINSFNSTCKTNLNNFFDSWIQGKVVVH